MNEVSKSDWKLYRSKIAQWQEDYMDRLVKEYIAMLQADEDASDKFWNRTFQGQSPGNGGTAL